MAKDKRDAQIDVLNAQFSIPGRLSFQSGENALPMVKIDNGLVMAEVYLHGAHITAFQPQGSEPVLWMSPLAQFQNDKAIRGGVPVIWPWFGPHAADVDKPQHGFARTAEWRVNATRALADGSTQLQLCLSDTADTHALWPYAFELSLMITVGTELNIELTAHNIGEQTFTAGAALHSYFAVGDVKQISVDGLHGCNYIDQLDGNRIKQQNNAVRIAREVDRIYTDTDTICVIHDALLSRRLHIKKTGSRSTVVWNPWNEKAKGMADFSDEGYQRMLCIETANAADDVRQLAPGETHTLSQTIAASKGTP
jgi:glucose-6-phosphate 1-epimerase